MWTWFVKCKVGDLKLEAKERMGKPSTIDENENKTLIKSTAYIAPKTAVEQYCTGIANWLFLVSKLLQNRHEFSGQPNIHIDR